MKDELREKRSLTGLLSIISSDIRNDKVKLSIDPDENYLIELIQEALIEFAQSRCPYCQAYIGPDDYIDRKDIERWLRKR